MASENHTICKQGNVGKRKRVTLMIHQKLEIIMTLESGES